MNLKPDKLKYTATDFIEAGVDREVALQFMIHRKAKGATNTKIAITRIVNESRIAGISLEAAMIVMMENDWKGFKAEWYRAVMAREMASQPRTFIDTHKDTTWADGFIDKHTDRTWRDGL